MKTQTRKEKRKIAFWVSLDAQGIGLIGCSGEGLKLDRGKVRLGAELLARGTAVREKLPRGPDGGTQAPLIAWLEGR